MFVFLIIFFYSVNIIFSSYILLPFQTENESDSFIQSKYDINLHTYLEIGEPKQKIKTYFRDEFFSFFILNNDTKYNEEELNITQDSALKNTKNINYLYNHKLSSTYKNISKYQNFFIDIYYRKGFLSSESFYFNSNNENNLKKFDNLDFVLVERIKPNRTLMSGVIGLLVDEYFLEGAQNFARMLVKQNVTKYCLWSKIYNDDNKGNFIFGDYPHEVYSYKFFKEQYIETDIKLNVYKQKWNLNFNEMFIEIKNNIFDEDYLSENNSIDKYFYLNQTLYGELKHNLGLIIGSVEYQNLIENTFFKYYIKKNICHKNKMLINDFNDEKVNYTFYSCKNDGSFKKQNFPSLFLRQNGLNYIFELNQKDLFVLDNNKWYFMIIFEGEEIADPIHKWMFGEPLLKKYNFVFDPINYKIGFYNPQIPMYIKKNNKKNNENINTCNFRQITSLIIFVLFLGIILFLLYNKLMKKILADKTNKQPYTELQNLNSQKFY